ncbi:MAG: methylmalonyl Co-A mutase-associated GTPase MeaB [bacterium]|nr:methylmalonyl Co-A mutase-associated GTPase MeaB [bacterium]
MTADSANPGSRAELEAARKLAERVCAGERSAISQALNAVDDNRPDHREARLALLDAVASHARGVRIGVTGAPGAGKSTLLDALVSGLRERDRSVGVLAVDPSSQRTGGALLGDRMRLSSSARDAGVFLRSLAARDQLGGLSEVTGPSLDILSAALDYVFVETVGVGQSEAQVIDVVDTLVFVAQPAAGDLIQFMKAGILEWPDLFFVNKSDLGDVATRAAAELRAGLDLGQRRDPDRVPPVLTGSARDGLGIDALIDGLEEHTAYLAARGLGEARRREGRSKRIEHALQVRYGRFGVAKLGSAKDLATAIEADPSVSVDRMVDALGRRIERALTRAEAPDDPRGA